MPTQIENENTRAIAANTEAISELIEALSEEVAARQAAVDAAVEAAKAYADSVSRVPYTLPPATAAELGGVKVDGRTVTADPDGTIHAAVDVEALPSASTATAGVVKVDGTTVTVHDGVLTVVGGGGGGASLTGVVVDITTTDGLYEAVKTIAQAMGATVNE